MGDMSWRFQRRGPRLLLAVSLLGTLALTSPARAVAPTPTTSPVLSAGVIAENQLPGTTAWQISPTAKVSGIAGFLSRDAAVVGDSVSAYVTTSAATYTVTAFRMGYYRGLGARSIWQSPVVVGHYQPGCGFTAGVNLVSCANWSRSLVVPITAEFVPGMYLFKLVGSGGQQAYMPLTIWDPTSTSALLAVGRSMTEQGWNLFGGYDFYQGRGACAAGAATYPPCNRARMVSLDRPNSMGNGASDFLWNEWPLLSLAEEHGLDISYVTDITLSEHPALMLHHRAILSLGHDETWTESQRAGALTAMRHGVNLVFFGSAAVLRHARLAASPLGVDRVIVNYRDSYEDPLNGHGNPLEVTGNTFAMAPTGQSPMELTGELYSGYTWPSVTEPLVVHDASSWLYGGTGLKNGSAIVGVIRNDFDHLALTKYLPPTLHVLAHSPIPAGEVTTSQGVWSGRTYADTSYWTSPVTRAGVFNAGTVNWIPALRECSPTLCPATAIRVMTMNVLTIFGAGPVGLSYPAIPNWREVTPLGS